MVYSAPYEVRRLENKAAVSLVCLKCGLRLEVRSAPAALILGLASGGTVAAGAGFGGAGTLASEEAMIEWPPVACRRACCLARRRLDLVGGRNSVFDCFPPRALSGLAAPLLWQREVFIGYPPTAAPEVWPGGGISLAAVGGVPPVAASWAWPEGDIPLAATGGS